MIGILHPHLNYRFKVSLDIDTFSDITQKVKKFHIDLKSEQLTLSVYQPITNDLIPQLHFLCRRSGEFDICLDQNPQIDNNDPIRFKGCRILSHDCEYDYGNDGPTLHHLTFSFRYIEKE